MKKKYLTRSTVRLTADADKWLTVFIDGYHDILMYSSTKELTTPVSKMGMWHEVTDEQDANYNEAKAAAEAEFGDGGND